jgi:HPr kinase/phosphorylase
VTLPQLHASCVAFGERGILITGRSGAGKSTLALRLIALGATLVADDRVALREDGARVHGSAPAAIRGRIEARGVGILVLPARKEAPLVLVADLDEAEPARLPAPAETRVAGPALPLVRARGLPDAAAALAAWVGSGGARIEA